MQKFWCQAKEPSFYSSCGKSEIRSLLSVKRSGPPADTALLRLLFFTSLGFAFQWCIRPFYDLHGTPNPEYCAERSWCCVFFLRLRLFPFWISTIRPRHSGVETVVYSPIQSHGFIYILERQAQVPVLGRRRGRLNTNVRAFAFE